VPATLALTLANRMPEVERMHAALEAFADAHAVPAGDHWALRLVLEELVANVVMHAYPAGNDGVIHVDVTLSDGVLTATVEDGGPPFDPLARPPADTSAALEERPVGGMGIHLVRTLTDEAAYERRGGRNRVRVTRRTGRPPAAGEPPCR
jgi:serine/threonine-protein kinase RsbW